MTLTTDQMCEVIDRAMDDIRELRRENAALLNALEEARDERDEARRQRDDVLDELDEARSDYEKLKHQVYASAAIPPGTTGEHANETAIP
jgi:ElaB/YqjD/DUF883 family membrane-anchored ribosome-binding protein